MRCCIWGLRCSIWGFKRWGYRCTAKVESYVAAEESLASKVVPFGAAKVAKLESSGDGAVGPKVEDSVQAKVLPSVEEKVESSGA